MAHRNEDGLIELTPEERVQVLWQPDFERDHIVLTEDGRFVITAKGEETLFDAFQKFAEVFNTLMGEWPELDEDDE